MRSGGRFRAFLGLLGLLGGLTQCTPFHHGLDDIVDALEKRHIAHCLFVHATMPPYGQVVVYGQAGELDCVTLWRGTPMP